MRMASVLLIAAILTTFAISGTFAKYTTSVESSDTARVAKWGFNTTSISITDLFSATYSNVASSDNSTDVIAPGTSGNAKFKFELATDTKPEVAYTFTVSTEGSNCDSAIVDNTSIRWALTESADAPVADNSEWGTWTALINKIKGLAGESDGSKEYTANTAPDMVDKTYYIHWMWAFENNDSGDTTMGNNISDLADVTLKITISATQID